MGKKNELPTATELAMIAAATGQPDKRVAAWTAFDIWEQCQRRLDMEAKAREYKEWQDEQPIPFDQALKKAGFTESTAAKREAAFVAILRNDHFGRVLLGRHVDAEEIDFRLEKLKSDGFQPDKVDDLRAVRSIDIREKKQAAGKARHAPKKRKS